MTIQKFCSKCGVQALVVCLTLLLAQTAVMAASHTPNTSGLRVLEDYPSPGLECEIAGIYPHPADDSLYFAAANEKPDYQPGQHPMLPVEFRGKLLVVDRHSGKIVNSFPLTGGQYGGIAYGEGHLFVSRLSPPEILKVNVENGAIVDRIPISGPAGGLKYDTENSVLVAQLYVSHPHLAVIDPKTKTTRETLWSDETAMDLANVRGDWLCTWVSGFDPAAFSELRLLDRGTGKVKGRVRLNGVYTSMAPLDKNVAGVDGFIAMVKLDGRSGRVVVRKHSYDGQAIKWM
jgi:hypothetical protein